MMSVYVELPSGTVLETNDPALWPDTKRLTKKAGKDRLRTEAFNRLRSLLRPGDTIHGVIRHVSASGMSRRIDFYLLTNQDKIYLTTDIGRVLDYKVSDKGGLVVGGCGMDMIFHVVHNLGYALYRDVAETDTPEATELRRLMFKADTHYYTQRGQSEPDSAKPGEIWKHGAGYAFKSAQI